MLPTAESPSPGPSGQRRPPLARVSTDHPITYIHPNGWKYYRYPRDRLVTAEDTTPARPENIADFGRLLNTDILIERVGDTQRELYVNHELLYASINKDHVMALTDDLKFGESLISHRVGVCSYHPAYLLHKDYWNFVRDFPSHVKLSQGAEDAAKEALLCYLTGKWQQVLSHLWFFSSILLIRSNDHQRASSEVMTLMHLSRLTNVENCSNA